MKVVFFNRKPIQEIHFSLENLFQVIRVSMAHEVRFEVKVMKFISKGFFKRLFISLEAAFNQGDVNHITGDIHFIAIFLRGNRTVLTIHDIGFMQTSNPIKRILLRLFWIVFPVKRVAVVTVVSMATKIELLKYVNIDPSRIRVIYNTFNPVFVPRRKVFNKTEPVILQLGTTSNKNISRLVEAITGMNCKLEIVGLVNKDLYRMLDDRKIKYTVYANLTLDQIVERYQHSDIVSFISTYEGFGLPIIESNATGRVVVTSDLLSMPEIGNDSVHLVNPYNIDSIRDGIQKVINDDEYRDNLIENGFKNVQRFAPAIIAGQYLEVYESLGRK